MNGRAALEVVWQCVQQDGGDPEPTRGREQRIVGVELPHAVQVVALVLRGIQDVLSVIPRLLSEKKIHTPQMFNII